MSREMTWKDAIIAVMREHEGEAMHPRDIADEILSRGLKTTEGATPDATVGAQIATSIQNQGDRSPFVKVARARYRLRDEGEATPPPAPSMPELDRDSESVDEVTPEVISAFGMFWQRENVIWRRRPQLLGAAHVDAKPVDFTEQFGIYLLYDGREVIYVGRAMKRALGTRLFEHTQDRLSARWDRFSWFGLRGVNQDGSLAPLDHHTYEPEQLIPALEAILIEAVEPRQNRKRGDDLALSEYIQLRDPEIEAQERHQLIQELAAGVNSRGRTHR
ncbi:hypothetical protein A6K26_009140 [Gammaproteobacteria bacterium 2W06]|nr:hypothetical protein A6K26_009140 [Gammaproteobacteria bacterium 2W06]